MKLPPAIQREHDRLQAKAAQLVLDADAVHAEGDLTRAGEFLKEAVRLEAKRRRLLTRARAELLGGRVVH